MRIDWLTLGLQTVNAIILIWLLSRFLFRPIADIIAARRAEATRRLDDAEAAKAGAAAARAAADAALAGIATGRAEALAEAGRLAAHEKEAMLAAARAEIDKLRESEAAALAHERDAARAETRRLAGTLAFDIARRLLGRLPPEAQVAPFIAPLAEAAAALPKAAPTPLRLIAPRPLTDDEAAACRAALAAATGSTPALTFEADPALIAGLELEGEHLSVRNSFRADLARIAAEIEKDPGDGG